MYVVLSSSASLIFVNVVFSGKRTLKNIGGGPEKDIDDLSDALIRRRRDFLDRAIISTEITVFQILDDLRKIPTLVSDAGRWSLMVPGLPIR